MQRHCWDLVLPLSASSIVGADDSGLWNIEERGCDNEKLGTKPIGMGALGHARAASGDHDSDGSTLYWNQLVQDKGMCNYFSSRGNNIIDQSPLPLSPVEKSIQLTPNN